MIAADAWRGRRYAVLGLARSGLATVRALAAAGAHVVAWDSNSAAREKAGAIDGVLIHDPATLDLTGAAGLVVSPGVPLNTHPLVAQARAAGVPIVGDIELFAEARGALPPRCGDAMGEAMGEARGEAASSSGLAASAALPPPPPPPPPRASSVPPPCTRCVANRAAAGGVSVAARGAAAPAWGVARAALALMRGGLLSGAA